MFRHGVVWYRWVRYGGAWFGVGRVRGVAWMVEREVQLLAHALLVSVDRVVGCCGTLRCGRARSGWVGFGKAGRGVVGYGSRTGRSMDGRTWGSTPCACTPR